jgi:hypothetical protein
LWFDQGCKLNRANLHGLLSQSIKQLAARFGFAAIKSKGELVQVTVQGCATQKWQLAGIPFFVSCF